MSTSLTILENEALPAALGQDLAAAVDLAKAEKAASPRKAYGIDFRLFKAWCHQKGVSSLPAGPETVAAFLAAETGNGIKPSTLGRRVAAIRYAHELAHLDAPTDSEAVKATLRGIRRTFGGAKVRKAPAIAQRCKPWRPSPRIARLACGIVPCFCSALPARSGVRSWWRWTLRTSRRLKPAFW